MRVIAAREAGSQDLLRAQRHRSDTAQFSLFSGHDFVDGVGCSGADAAGGAGLTGPTGFVKERFTKPVNSVAIFGLSAAAWSAVSLLAATAASTLSLAVFVRRSMRPLALPPVRGPTVRDGGEALAAAEPREQCLEVDAEVGPRPSRGCR